MAKKDNRTKEEIWKITLAQIEVKLDNTTQFRTWFSGTKLIKLHQDLAIIGVRNHYNATWLKDKHHLLIQDTISYVCDRPITIEYKITQELANDPIPTFTPDTDPNSEEEPSLLDLEGGQNAEIIRALNRYKIDPNYTFDSFIVGEFNQMAHAAAKAIAKNPGKIYNPFFIYGNTGLGKTHLAHAIARKILEKKSSQKIIYVPAETFLNQMINAIKSGRTKKFRERYRDSVELFILDDVQFISTWERTQTEFFNTFNTLHSAEKQIIIISDRAPEELKKLTPRLRSRFQGGMVADISKPSFEHRVAILEAKLQKTTNKKLNLEIIKFIAKNYTDNIRELEGALQQVILMDSLKQGNITIEEVAVQLGKDAVSKRKKITIPKVFKTVAKEFDISVREIKGKRRTKDIALARQVCMYILREELNYKLEEIASFINRKDHTTVMHGIDKIKSLRLSEEIFRDQLIKISENLNQI